VYNLNERNKSIKIALNKKTNYGKLIKKLELLFRIVLALLKALRIGLDCDIKGQGGHKP